MFLHITGRRLIGQPDVISHLNAVEEVVTAPKQTRDYRPPSAVRDDLPGTYTLVFELLGKLIAICAQEQRAHSRLLGWLRLWDDRCWVAWHVPGRSGQIRLVGGGDGFVQRNHSVASEGLANLCHESNSRLPVLPIVTL